MEAILKFNLPEEAAELKYAQDGGKWMVVVEEVANEIRNLLKYGNVGIDLTEQEKDIVRGLQEFLFSAVDERDLILF